MCPAVPGPGLNRYLAMTVAAPKRTVALAPLAAPRLGQLLLPALAIWCAAFVALALLPNQAPPRTRGLYAQEGGPQPFRWTSSRTTIPIDTAAEQSLVALTIASGRWPERAAPVVTLRAGEQQLVQFAPADELRRYRLLLPHTARELVLESTVARPPGDDRRWLGVQLHDVSVLPAGPPLRAAQRALVIALLSLPLLAAFVWARRRGLAGIAAVSLLGLGLRLYRLDDLPAGFFQDEAVSLADAWSMVQTGRDHLGNWLPLGAFEAFGDWVSPLLTYLEMPLVAWLGPEPLVGRLVVAIVSALAIPALYTAARALRLPVWAALVTALVAAVSPWQLVRSRVATPPGVALLLWALCLLAALLFLERRSRGRALLVAATFGLGVYAYPTMKMAVPLLGMLTLLLAVWAERTAADGSRQRWWPLLRRLVLRWWPAAPALAVLWLPFIHLTFFHEYSAMRAQQKFLRAPSAAEWTLQWLAGYSTYFRPEFYFLSGDASNGIPGQGVELWGLAPVVLAGLAALLWRIFGRAQGAGGAPREAWWLLGGALLIAPLPASLMTPNPHLSRALIVAPQYALLVGLGAATLAGLAARRRRELGALALGAIVAVTLWQGAARYRDYLENYPAVVARKYQDGLREAMTLAIAYAPGYDEVWVDDGMSFPYAYVLALRGVEPAEAHRTVVVDRPRTTFNTVRQVGAYRFISLKGLPADLPVLEAVPDSLGEPGYLLRELQHEGRRVLLVGRM